MKGEIMDRYTKFVLTIIAIAVSLIAVKLYEIPEANANLFTQGPTYGDLIAIREIKNQDEKKKLYNQLHQQIPLVIVRSGKISVSGSVDIDD